MELRCAAVELERDIYREAGANTVKGFRLRNAWLLLAFTILGFAVMGYHPGLEDDGAYLAAVKSDLNPALYPHDAAFFRVQLQATVFDGWMAGFVRLTGMRVEWAELLWQLASIATILYCCFAIARRLFQEEAAQWAGVAMVAAMLTLPVAGTALNVADQHLHPRNLASALILLAVERVLAGRRWQAVPWLAVAFALHPIMAAMGISFCFFLAGSLLDPAPGWMHRWHGPAAAGRTEAGASSPAAFAPLGWIFAASNPTWRTALNTRSYLFIARWAWYEWLGALAPLFLFWLLWRVAQRRGHNALARFALAVFVFGVFQQAIAILLQSSPALVRMVPLQPMRYLHLVYIFMALAGGCLIGQFLLKASVWRWVVFLLVFNGGMFAVQREMYSGSQHLELPGRVSANPWLQAFAWIRGNTPADAYFALGPRYLAEPNEDFHGFRALAERSQLADAVKDGAMAAMVPELAAPWLAQVHAQQGWTHFKLADFERLKAEFGVDWVVVSYPPADGLKCRWHNEVVTVCQVP